MAVSIRESDVWPKEWPNSSVKTSNVATQIADLELRVRELERKTTAKELTRAVAREMLAARSKE